MFINSLTLPGLGFFENLRAGRRELVGPRVISPE